MNDKIARILSQLPSSPGVYLMKDKHGDIIYIGKAKSLKNRVSSYFQNTKKNVKTSMLVSNIDSLDYILTASELDAFSLESNLIKQHLPKYNILLKDDKMFPYIRIDKNQLYPEITIARRVKKDGAMYFGPFVTGLRVSEFISIIKSVFKVRQCAIKFEKRKNIKRQCLYGDMGKCLCPCLGQISNDDYLKIIDEIIDFLNGDTVKVRRLLTEKMNECSKKMDFEGAIDARDKIEMIKKSETYILTNLTKSANFDVFTINRVDDFVAVNQTTIRNGKTIVDKNILLEAVEEENLDEVLSEFLVQYYDANVAPNELLTNIELPNLGEYLSHLSGKKIEVRVPSKGIKRKIVDMGLRNIDEFLSKNLEVQKRRKELNLDALEELARVLNLESIPYRLECYDISNISGTNNVSSMVVFENGEPQKKEYRKFKIKTVVGADDFASMEETLRRRLARLKENDKSFNKAPSLIVIDGGLGQLNSAEKVVRELGLDIPVISIAKKQEEIFMSGFATSIVLDERNNARKLLQRIRDEAHRFAINYHRSLRDKAMFE